MNIRLGILILLLWIPSPQLLATEEILDFDSIVTIQNDGSMKIEERIRVRAEGEKIKRGIYRDFPTRYHDRLGNQVNVRFRLLEVLRDGVSEAHHSEVRDNGIRIYAGKQDKILDSGVYEYTFQYLIDRQLGYFEHHDELYWNVTGNGWDFPIQRASATIYLPSRVPENAIGLEGYTGPQGARKQDYEAWTEAGGARFRTTSVLGTKEGLTIVVTWPKGYVVEPGLKQRIAWMLADNRPLLIAGGGIALLLAYYLLSWYRVGKDPSPGLVIPIYQPPDGYSPAALRFIDKMGYDNKAFTAALVNMAVKGYLKIEESEGGTFTLRKTGAKPKLAPGEGAIASALFGSGSRSIRVEKRNHRQIGKAVKAHKRALHRDYEKSYFITNSIYIVPGALLSLTTIALALSNLPQGTQAEVTGFMILWLSIWSIGVFALATTVVRGWRNLIRTGSGLASVIATTLFALPFFAGEVFGIFILFSQGAPLLAVLLLTLALINFFFYQWMKTPTLEGRKLLDQAAGFNLYLSVAEKDELNFRHPPEKTAELFERYLPFAIALGVEQRWAERFSSILADSRLAESGYSPGWYQGRSWNRNNLGHFGTAIGSSMSSAIASSSSAPGSSSGSGGGGSSGGGGGGGGGGGW